MEFKLDFISIWMESVDLCGLIWILMEVEKSLQVLGNAKGAIAVVVSILIFKNPISMIGMLGYGLTVIGVVLYSESKKRYSRN